MKVGSLFAGIGGFDLGLERAGFEITWQVEIDEWCRKVLKKHWPGVPKYGDIREVGAHNLEPVDLICGGFPCQPFSQAGQRRGEEDNRYLWPEMLRVIEELKPTWVIGENVAGILSMGFDAMLSDLEAKGYEVWPLVIPACAINAPHRRDRVWIVAYTRNVENSRSRGFGESHVCNKQSRGTQVISRSQNVANAATIHAQGQYNRQGEEQFRGGSWWAVEPDVGRVAHGIPSRVDRLKGLGNAVVPQIVEVIGRAIKEVGK